MNHRPPVILVVDPDEDRATLQSSRLDGRGYYAVRRSSGTDAVRFVAECRPDLVLSEIDLLDVESRELLQRIREISPETQVLFISRQGRGLPNLGVGGHHILRQDDERDATEEIVQEVDRLLEQSPTLPSVTI